jgi:hypothetical protein
MGDLLGGKNNKHDSYSSDVDPIPWDILVLKQPVSASIKHTLNYLLPELIEKYSNECPCKQ